MQVQQTPTPSPVIVAPPAPPPGGSPSAIYRAFVNQREVLDNQLDRLEDQRRDLQEQLRRQPEPVGADKTGLETRIGLIDQRIAAVEKQIEEADAAVARTAAIPGAIVERPPAPPRSGPDEEVVAAVTVVFMIVVLLPLTIAYARRIWRRGAAVATALPQEIWERFTRVEQGVDAIAVEVERIGEGQRFLTRMYADQQRQALGAGPAERIEVGDRDRERQSRK